ncbi:MAG: host attachment protein [Gammaproteobacteria bacterium]|nr:host attachment protein [Gammaproteobacteria bacterium]
MTPFMIVVADSTRARIFTTDSAHSPLLEIETMAHPEGRLHDRDVTSDLPGKDAGAGGSGGHAYEAKTDPKKHELAEFAKRLADHLDDARTANKLSNLLLVAEPAFLGELRAHLSSQTKALIVFELDKNLTHHSPEDIRKHLPKFLTH